MSLPFFPQTTLILGPRRKSEDNLKLNDDGSELRALNKRGEKNPHHILTGLGMRAGRLPRKPRRAVDKWAFGTLCDQRGSVRHSPSSCPGMVFEVMKT